MIVITTHRGNRKYIEIKPMVTPTDQERLDGRLPYVSTSPIIVKPMITPHIVFAIAHRVEG